jgi:putative transposase
MKRKRYTEEQIISTLKEHEAGRSMVDLAREHGTETIQTVLECFR